jgi:hypothetical protein
VAVVACAYFPEIAVCLVPVVALAEGNVADEQAYTPILHDFILDQT